MTCEEVQARKARSRLNGILEEIARKELNVKTLIDRKSDMLDWYEVAVWQIEAALKAAYIAGLHDLANIRES